MKIKKTIFKAISILAMIVGVLLGCFLGYYFHGLSIPYEIFVFFMAVLSIFVIYFLRHMPESWKWFLIGGGVVIGIFLNISLSTEFISEPSIIAGAGFFLISFIWLWTSLTLRKDVGSQEKLAFVFLGCWIASLALALIGFCTSLSQWLSLLPSQKMTGGHIQVEASVIINILKSLFLSGVFNVLERIMRLSKEGVK